MQLLMEDTEPIPVASVTRRAALEDIGEAASDGFRVVMAALSRRGLEPLGPPLIAYPEPMREGEPIAMIIAVPIEPGVASLEDVEVQTIPGGRVAAALHVGPYARLAETYERMMSAMAEQGLRPTAGPREIYLSDPDETPEQELTTRIEFPVGA